jgi:hypothetical protein
MTFIALLIVCLTACTAPIQISPTTAPAQTLTSAKDLIEPGDKIGNFLIATGIDEEVMYVSKLHCPFDAKTGTESCEIPVGTKVNVSNSFYDPNDRDGAGLDDIWARHTYKMSIEGRLVNLEAFGPIDTYHPVAGKLRNWNVVIFTNTPGTISIKGNSTLDNETVEMNVVLTFAIP